MKNAALALGVLLAGFHRAYAQASSEQAPLTWEQCMSIALENNPTLLASEHALAASERTYKGSFNGIFPHLSLNNSYANSDTLVQTERFTNAARWQEGANASLDIFNAQDYAVMSTDKAQEVQAQANLRQVFAQVRLSLAQAFIKLLYNQNRLAVDQEIADIQKTNAQMVSLEYNSGEESQGDMMTANAQMMQADVSVSNDKLNIEEARVELNRQLGRDQFDVAAVTGTLVYAKISAPDYPSLIEKNPSVIVAKAGVVLSRAGLETSEVSLWPDLSATASRSYNGPYEFPNSPHWSVGAALSLPIFGSGPTAAYYQITASKESLDEAKENLRAARENVMSVLHQDWANLSEDVDLVGVDSALFSAAMQRYTESTVRYKAGLMPFETWILSVSDLINFKQGYLSSQLNAAQAKVQWESDTGVGLGETVLGE